MKRHGWMLDLLAGTLWVLAAVGRAIQEKPVWTVFLLVGVALCFKAGQEHAKT
jgi:hypothetical protein